VETGFYARTSKIFLDIKRKRGSKKGNKKRKIETSSSNKLHSALAIASEPRSRTSPRSHVMTLRGIIPRRARSPKWKKRDVARPGGRRAARSGVRAWTAGEN